MKSVLTLPHLLIFQHGPANPSQESLSLSISGSGSLHSWNLETTEELSDQTEDSDWHCLDTSLQEEGAECLVVVNDVAEHEVRQREVGEKQKETNGDINGKQEININNFKEVKTEEEESKGDPANTERFEESDVKEMTEGTEDKITKDTRKDDEIQSVEGESKTINETKEEMKETQECTNNDSQEKLNIKYINKDDPLLNSVEEQHSEPPVTPGLDDVTADPKLPVSHEKERDKTPKTEEQGVRLTSPPPKVLSAVARFHGQPYSQQSFQLRSISKNSADPVFQCREKVQTLCDLDTNKNSEGAEEEDRPPVKVSELKKRFEA